MSRVSRGFWVAAVELCEYGRPASKVELQRLFPFFGT